VEEKRNGKILTSAVQELGKLIEESPELETETKYFGE
jgi:hypothetical protein